MYKEPRAFERIGGYGALACSIAWVLVISANGIQSTAASHQRASDYAAFSKIITDRTVATIKAVDATLRVVTVPEQQRGALERLLDAPNLELGKQIPGLVPGWVEEWLVVLMVAQYVLLLVSYALHRHAEEETVVAGYEGGREERDEQP